MLMVLEDAKRYSGVATAMGQMPAVDGAHIT